MLVADGAEVVLEAKTGADGVLLKAWDKPRDPSTRARATWSSTAPTWRARAWACPRRWRRGCRRAPTSTPTGRRTGRARRSHLRGVVREVEDGQYANVPGADLPPGGLRQPGPADRRPRPVTLSEFGTFHERLPLDAGAPVGTYRVRLYQPGKSDFAGQFEVQAYQLEKIDLAFDLPKTVYFRGETIEADVVARYQYGTPAGRPADRRAAPRRPRRSTGRPTRRASSTSSSPTEGFAEEQALRLVAQLPQDNVAAAAARDARGPGVPRST